MWTTQLTSQRDHHHVDNTFVPHSEITIVWTTCTARTQSCDQNNLCLTARSQPYGQHTCAHSENTITWTTLWGLTARPQSRPSTTYLCASQRFHNHMDHLTCVSQREHNHVDNLYYASQRDHIKWTTCIVPHTITWTTEFCGTQRDHNHLDSLTCASQSTITWTT